MPTRRTGHEWYIQQHLELPNWCQGKRVHIWDVWRTLAVCHDCKTSAAHLTTRKPMTQQVNWCNLVWLRQNCNWEHQYFFSSLFEYKSFILISVFGSLASAFFSFYNNYSGPCWRSERIQVSATSQWPFLNPTAQRIFGFNNLPFAKTAPLG